MTEPQAEKTLVHFLRHGEVHNPEGILYGRLPGYRLSDKGEQQAKLVAEFLSGHDIARVISSPLQRAQETARPLGAMFQVDVATDDRLIEADNRFEGLKVSVGDGALRSPRHWPKLWNPFAPSCGELYL
jgi:broad specificity phosphatase PhoE